MLRLLLALAMGGASTACALAAVGGVLYARHPAVDWVVQVFAAWGLLAGLVCGALHVFFQGQPAPAPAALSSKALNVLVRDTLALAAAEREARPGSAADRRPAAAASAPITITTPSTAIPPALQPQKLAAGTEATTP